MQPTATQKSISAAGTIGTCRSWTPSVHISDFAEIFEWMPQNVHKKCGVVQTATTQSWFFPHSNKMTVIFVFGHQKLVTGLIEWWTCRPLDCMIFVSIHFLPSLRTLSSPHLQHKPFPYSCKLAPGSGFGPRVFAALPGWLKNARTSEPQGNPLVKLLECVFLIGLQNPKDLALTVITFWGSNEISKKKNL